MKHILKLIQPNSAMLFFAIAMISPILAFSHIDKMESVTDLGAHSLVRKSDVFPYMAAILKKDAYLSSGALIDENWVITAADPLYLVRESLRTLRVRLGSTNYKREGNIFPIRNIEIHPSFDDTSPFFDIALVRLADKVTFKPNIHPITLLKKHSDITASHFIVTSWPQNLPPKSDLTSLEKVRQRRMLTVSHLHPTTVTTCYEILDLLSFNLTSKSAGNPLLMCLDPGVDSDPCLRDVGAPVALTGTLWGVLSSWKPEDCDTNSGPFFATLVSSPTVREWINSVRNIDDEDYPNNISSYDEDEDGNYDNNDVTKKYVKD